MHAKWWLRNNINTFWTYSCSHDEQKLLGWGVGQPMDCHENITPINQQAKLLNSILMLDARGVSFEYLTDAMISLQIPFPRDKGKWNNSCQELVIEW